MKFTVVTSFHRKGMEAYGQNFVNQFSEFWPEEMSLWIYAEDCSPVIPESLSNRCKVLDLHESCPELVEFKSRHLLSPKANGVRSNGYNYRFDSVRFSNKTFAVIHAMEHVESEFLIWCDADVITFKTIPLSFIEMLMPDWATIAWLDRHEMYPECGFYILDRKNKNLHKMMMFWKELYTQDKVFNCKEWHDSFVLEQLVKTGVKMKMVQVSSISGGGYKTEHPFINGPLGNYMDHLKGERKETGKSYRTDLKIPKKEEYWNA